MKDTKSELLAEPHHIAKHRYQVYRQSPNGCYCSQGATIETPDEAVALFIATSPLFEGGGIRLWDHREQRLAASAEWQVENTRMGFIVCTRSNVFHDASLASLAQQIAERERIEQTVASRLRMAI